MDAFPFTEAEWEEVTEVSWSVTNATLANDPTLRASFFMELQQVLHVLRGRYGEHSVLLETEADFSEDADVRLTLYRQSLELAERHSLPTLSIRLSLAQRLIECERREEAARELLACKREVECADRYDSEQWKALRNATGRFGKEEQDGGAE